ncbi:hypothetical protein BV898_02845 [Hypsibius exemplaris]|uniref:Solute-binding protein family 3/N-terminal domain-containing protein n=1 Tax=Hypsibius exemplaris TaxID=2072580 RepID=A0A1W0X782_HYPEX|nr:hypothetical protein BV898_02845 [Hypsibius exemplaris]
MDPFFVAANATTGTKNSGFLVELLDKLQAISGLPYTLTARPDLNYGTKNPNGTWDGSIIGVLVNNEADLIGADDFNWADRESAVDFLIPLLSYKLQILTNTQFSLNNATQYVTSAPDFLRFVCTSQNSVAQAICANILDSGDKGLVFDDDDGLATVLTGNFAYLGGSPFLDLAVAQNQGKVKVALNVGSLFAGLAVQQGSPLREKLNIALLQLFENGEVQSLFTKYGINN